MLRSACALVLAGFGVAVSLRAQPQEPESVAGLLARARAALGGEARLAGIQTFTMSGSIRRGYRHTVNHGSFEIAAALPDRFVSREALTYVRLAPVVSGGRVATERVQATLGFNAGRVIHEPSTPRVHQRVAPPVAGQAQVRHLLPLAQLDFLRVTLGLFAASFSGAPVTFTDPGDATRDRAVIVRLQGQPMRLEFDPVTHLPARLGDLTYADYREVDGVRVPFRLARTGSATWVDEWTIDTIRLNVAIPDRVFRAN